jgi:multicomponent Na+:H+ antiporter subunit D
VSWLAPAVLLLSALLTAGYLLPICIHGFFPGEGAPEADGKEAPRQMLVPIVILAAAVVIFGVFAGLLADPLKTIARNLL